MIDSLKFYCHYGAGDVYESKEFVRAWMRVLNLSKSTYYHAKDESLLFDMPEVMYKELTPELGQKFNHRWDVFNAGNHILVNTWIGRDGRYVLPGIGCVIEKHFEMHSDMMRKVGLGLPGSPIDYIPRIHFSHMNTDNLTDFVQSRNGNRLVLICTGNVQSNQAYNFDFTLSVDRLASQFRDIDFITTTELNISRPNLFFSGDITGGGFDLNKIAYLSTYCDTVIGRNSGPHVFAQNYENWMNPEMAFLSFTYQEIAATSVLTLPVKAQKYWSDAIDSDSVAKKMIEVVGRM